MHSLPERFVSTALRASFYLLYHQMAWSYDLVAATVSLGQWREWVLAVLPYLKGPRVLELGFGPGHLQLAMHQAGLDPLGLDESRQMVQAARRRLKSRGVAPRLVNGSAQELPFAGAQFDQVVATFPSDYIVRPGTLAEVRRVLIPGGRLVVLPFAWLTGATALHRSIAWLFRITGQATPASARQAFSEDSEWMARLVQPFEQAGFQVESKLLTLPASLMRSSNVLILLAQKPVAATKPIATKPSL